MSLLPLLAALALAADPAASAIASHPQAPAAAPASAAAVTVAPSAGPTAAVPFLPGEQMDFSVEFGGFKAGEARIRVGARAGALLPVFLEAKTTGLVGLISLRQVLVSNLEVASGLPRSTQIDGVEPSYRHTDTARFDRVENVATVREQGKHDNTYRVEVPPGTLDFVALVFKLRTLPLADGARYEYPVLAGRKVSQVVVTVEGREKVETYAGEVAAIRVRVPTAFTGKFSEKSPTYLWFSDDARRTVVRISADFFVGRGNAVLSGARPGREAP